MNWLNDIVSVLNDYLWSYILIIMLVAVYPACFKAVESRFARTTANAE